MAFAGPDLEADFAKMKGTDIDEELGIEQKRNKILNDGTDIFTNVCLLCSVFFFSSTTLPTLTELLCPILCYSLILVHRFFFRESSLSFLYLHLTSLSSESRMG